ncbi:MAG TPA: hypothetical protein PKY82_02610 [Pyrinomonadaceae bacterium]|nr:hypothetical protein [Pyrinomonadaceae bacterium]
MKQLIGAEHMTEDGRKTARLFVELETLEQQLINEILPKLVLLGFESTRVFQSLEIAQAEINKFIAEREVVQMENSLIEMVKRNSHRTRNNPN